MDNTKNDQYYIDRLIKDMRFISVHMTDQTLKSLEANELLQDSMMFRLVQISENSRKLSDDYKEENQQIPWKDMYGLRNRIVHEYGNVDLHIVYDTLVNDIPWLLKEIEKYDRHTDL